MSTLAVVEEILRETQVPMTVREIVERAGSRLPSKSKTPDTVVARDLSMDIKLKGEASSFVRPSPGRYTLRALGAAPHVSTLDQSVPVTPQSLHSVPAVPAAAVTSIATDGGPDGVSALSSTMRGERAAPMAARKQTQPGDEIAVAPHANR